MRVIELSEAVGAENRAFATLLRKIGSEQMRAPVDGKLTTKDILGHVAAYLEAERLALASGTGRAREAPIYFDDYQKWHEEEYDRRRGWTPGRIMAEVEENSARYLSLVKSLHEEDLIKQVRFPWNETGTVHALILEGLKHRREHREELAAALGLAG
ncbi:MAG TPA: DinB family protein [Herpetosiphonaceae bacterium]|nr:DinB family protein [Herpetosiphonaceae bacterium]